ncbi:MAG: PaaI family thioesterase [Pikeienuella sp.]
MTLQPVMTTAEAAEYLAEIFPAVDGKFEILELSSMGARLRMRVNDSNIRPGGTVSGPSMFELADCGFYMAVLGMIGRQALTVTTNANINFLRKPEACDMIGEARILKLGKLLATGDVTMYSEGDDQPVAHATLTYAIPPKG